MKVKMMIAVALAACTVNAFAGRGCGPCHPCRPCPPPYRPCGPCHRPCDRDWWGRGGRNFWPGFIGGVVGGVVAGSVTRSVVYDRPVMAQPVVVQSQPVVVQSQPVVVQSQPVVVQSAPVMQSVPATATRSVWVEGRYVDQMLSNGTVTRVWQPGHYDQQTIVVGERVN